MSGHRMSMAARLEKYSIPEPNSGCLLWLGAISRYGYGLTWKDGKSARAHRVSYEIARGPIPDGLTIDHLCRNRACIEPRHLEAVTLRENLLRGDTFQAANARKTECAAGHPFDEANTRRDPSGKRRCRTCEREQAYLGFLRRRARGYVRKDRERAS